MTDEDNKTEVGSVTGLPLDLPPGRHPFDGYLYAMTRILGMRTTARYLGFTIVPRNTEET